MPRKNLNKKDENVEIGKRLRYLREKHHLTTRELGELIGMDYGSIASIERGENGMSAKTLSLFVDYYNVSYDYILGKTQNELISMGYAPKNVYEILDTIEFRNALQERVVKMVLALKDESLEAIENVVMVALEREQKRLLKEKGD